jgi:acetolactate synthase-1/2/3 large subunit
MVRQWQELFHHNRYSFVNIKSPDYVQVANGYHIHANKVEKREFLKDALLTMINHDGPYLLEVMVGKENSIFPMVPQGRGVSEIVLSKEEI